MAVLSYQAMEQIYVGEVAASQVPEEEAPPLVYWNRGYRKLRLHDEPPPLPPSVPVGVATSR